MIAITGASGLVGCNLVRALLAQKLGRTVLYHEHSQFAGALGAALLALESQ